MSKIFTVSALMLGAMLVSNGAMAQPRRSAEFEDRDGPPAAGGWQRHSTIAPGSEIVVRTIDSIRSSAADPKRHFLASIDRDIVDDHGNVVIPRGASAHLIVADAGNRQVAIDLRSVNFEGRRYVLNAEDLANGREHDSVGANQRTGKFVGGGAIVGGILGAVAGGGKGAAIGAVAGGAVGASAEVATSGTSIRIPSETVLRFRLDHPVYIYR